MSGCRKRFITLQPRRSQHGTTATYILVTSEKGPSRAPSAISSTRQQSYFAKEDTRLPRRPLQRNLHSITRNWSNCNWTFLSTTRVLQFPSWWIHWRQSRRRRCSNPGRANRTQGRGIQPIQPSVRLGPADDPQTPLQIFLQLVADDPQTPSRIFLQLVALQFSLAINIVIGDIASVGNAQIYL